jgi:16S rRNA (guanine527-N7)-methyltransferase
LPQSLDAGLDELVLPLTAAARRTLLDYLALLSKWNAVYNLTAVREPAAMLVQHLLDSLAIIAPLEARGSFQRVLDVGSGGGLPGIVLAVAWPQSTIHLIEPVGKKAAFLRQCAAELALTHVHVHCARVEELRDPAGLNPDLIVCRAFASLPVFVTAIEALVTPATTLAAMKGNLPEDEIAGLPGDWRVAETVRLVVPGLEAQRHLLLLERSAAGV